MRLLIDKPIAFVDLETTGTDRENDRIVEISICKLREDGFRESAKTRRINPGVPIPAASTKIHGITDADVAECPTFPQIAKGLLRLLEGCDIGGFNSNMFDIPVLYNEFLRAGITWNYYSTRFFDAGNIFKIQEPRTLAAAVKFYTGENHEDAHSAEADIVATVEVFLAQAERYRDTLPVNMDELALFCNFGNTRMDIGGKFVGGPDGVIILNFGKYKGQPAHEHIDFLEWMVGPRATFAPDTLQIAENLLFQHRAQQDDGLPF